MRLSEKKKSKKLSEDEILQLEVEYEKLLSEFKDNPDDECTGLCKYIDSWSRSPTSTSDGNSAKIDAAYIYNAFLRDNNFLSKRSIASGIYRIGGNLVIDIMTSSGTTILTEISKLAEYAFSYRDKIGELSKSFDKLAQASDIIETYLNYDDDSLLGDAIDYIHMADSSLRHIDNALGGDSIEI